MVKTFGLVLIALRYKGTGKKWTQWSSSLGTYLECERCGFKSHLFKFLPVGCLREKILLAVILSNF